MNSLPPLPREWTSIAEALLIGLLIGIQRETIQSDRRPGLRDFLVVAMAGGVCGLLQQPALTVVVLAAITLFTTIYYLRATERAGITTEFAVVATFLLCYLTATPNTAAAPVAIALAIVLVFALETKTQLHHLVRETITHAEFRDTLRFLAIIFIIFPLLPEGQYGPYEFFHPRRVWLFVILVSSISYLGYFAEKFCGVERGLRLIATFGGLASTTAATAALARNYREQPDKLTAFWEASTLANAIQFPRIWAIVAVLNTSLATAMLPLLAAMTAPALLLVLLLARRTPPLKPAPSLPVGNPFRLTPAIRFGLLFALIQLASRWAFAAFGSAFTYTTALAGALDADAITISLTDLVAENQLSFAMAEQGVFLALAANALVKTGIAAFGGGAPFGLRVGAAFALMLVSGGAVLLLGR
jgi:uncharacterized membrane protein (DUF4010 family)